MSCSACAVNVENTLKAQKGVTLAAVNFADHNAFIEYDPEAVSIEELKKKVKDSGYDFYAEQISEEEINAAEAKDYKQLRKKLIFSAVFSLPVFIISMFAMDALPYASYIMFGLSLPVIFYGGALFYRNAWKQAKHFSVNMDTLVALSTGIAFLFSVFNTFFPFVMSGNGMEPHVYYESATVIITFILLGKLLETRAKNKASFAVRQLINLQPKTCIVVRGNMEIILPVMEIEPEDVVIVKAGQKIPVDGKIKSGNTFIDESMITGEPLAAEKSQGDDVFAGTINQKGMITVIADKYGDSTMLSQIIQLVREAQSQKAPLQKLADKIAGVFVPVVLAISLITFVTWMLIGPQPALTHAFMATITVIIIACPCALGLATPTALIAGIGNASRNGILIRNAEALEKACQIDTLVLDKTGTLTTGKAGVSEILWITPDDSELNKSLLFTIESGSGHPLAGPITDKLKGELVVKGFVTGIEDIPAKGVRAEYNEAVYFVGNDKMLNDFDIELNNNEKAVIEKHLSEGKTIVYFGKRNKLLSIIVIADELRETSAEAVLLLRKAGINVCLLTGDNAKTATFIAAKAGIVKFQAEMLPAGKAEFISELQKQGHRVAMAGDGINDAIALAQADLGISLASGTDIAVENAGIVLMKSDLQHIVKAIKLSKLTVRFIRQNLFWAFIYNLVALPVAAGVLYPLTGFLLSPMIAGAAMSMSSVSVVTNSLRLTRVKI